MKSDRGLRVAGDDRSYAKKASLAGEMLTRGTGVGDELSCTLAVIGLHLDTLSAYRNVEHRVFKLSERPPNLDYRRCENVCALSPRFVKR